MTQTNVYRIEGSARTHFFSTCKELARWALTGIPFSTSSAVGSNRRAQGKRPYSWWAAQYPANSPGTATAKPPVITCYLHLFICFWFFVGEEMTSLRNGRVALEHVFRGGDGRHFTGVEASRYAPDWVVDSHEESTANSGALRIDCPDANGCGDRRVHRISSFRQNISVENRLFRCGTTRDVGNKFVRCFISEFFEFP